MIDQEKYPERFKYIIKNIFNSREEAIQAEIDDHELNDVAVNPNYYNKAKQTSIGFDTSGMKFPGKNKGNIFIYNNELEKCKHIPLVKFEQFKKQGWKLGKKFINPGTKNFIWIKKDKKDTLINPNLFNFYEKQGWVKGRLKTSSNSEDNQKIRRVSKKRNAWKKYCKKINNFFDRPKEGTIIEIFNKNKNKFSKIPFSIGSLNWKFKDGWIYTGEILND